MLENVDVAQALACVLPIVAGVVTTVTNITAPRLCGQPDLSKYTRGPPQVAVAADSLESVCSYNCACVTFVTVVTTPVTPCRTQAKACATVAQLHTHLPIS